MQKREIKDAIEELSNNLVNRIMIVTQDLLILDKKEKGEFLKQGRFDSEFDLPRSLFYVILKKVAEEFSIENKNVKDILKEVKEYLGVIDVERKRSGKSEEANTEAT